MGHPKFFGGSVLQKPANSGENRQKSAKNPQIPKKIVEIRAFCLDFAPPKVAW